MGSNLDTLIDRLADQARPVRRQSTALGRWILAAVATASFGVVFAVYGFREDITGLQPSPLLAIALGIMALLAIAAGSGAVRMARPQVGAAASGAPWALAALLLLPVSGLALVAAQPAYGAGLDPAEGLRCVGLGVVAATGSLAFLTSWLRRGAPVAPGQAAWLAGLSSGAIGAFAVTLECPDNDFVHLAIWHVSVVLALAGFSRLVLPRFLRW